MSNKEIIEIIRSLPEWFTPEAVPKVKLDLKNKSVLSYPEKNILGFIIYEITKDKCYLAWMAVRKNSQGKGVGKKLIKDLISLCKRNKVKCIEVDTLAETEDYLPYNKTRDFYYSVGFKKYKIIKKGYSEGTDKLILRMRV